jgi:hypothetical protein
LLCKYSFLGCAPLFSYMDSKGHHHEPLHPLGVSWTNVPKPSCPFMDLVHPNELVFPLTIAYLGTNVPQPWCAPHVDVPQPLWCTPSSGCFHPMLRPMLGKSLSLFTCPRRPLSQLVWLLGVIATPIFFSLRTWERVFVPF